MKNEKIGIIGESFIQKQLELGIEFEAAWDDWQSIQRKLIFVTVDCPEVQFYDDRRISDSQERQRIRDSAKSKLGDDIRSADVSVLGRLAQWLGVEMTVRPYHMDRQLVATWARQSAEEHELEYGFDDRTARVRRLAESNEMIETMAQNVEEFAEDHGLWAVPSERMIELYLRHRHRLRETTFNCDACGEETVIPVDHQAGRLQHIRTECPKCSCTNHVTMLIDDAGDTCILSTGRQLDDDDNPDNDSLR